jgi:hypothetical protein
LPLVCRRYTELAAPVTKSMKTPKSMPSTEGMRRMKPIATTGPLMRNFVRLINAPCPHVRHNGFCCWTVDDIRGGGGGTGVPLGISICSLQLGQFTVIPAPLGSTARCWPHFGHSNFSSIGASMTSWPDHLRSGNQSSPVRLLKGFKPELLHYLPLSPFLLQSNDSTHTAGLEYAASRVE